MQIFKNGEYSRFSWANPRNSSLSGPQIVLAASNGAFGHNQAGKVIRRAVYERALATLGWGYLE